MSFTLTPLARVYGASRSALNARGGRTGATGVSWCNSDRVTLPHSANSLHSLRYCSATKHNLVFSPTHTTSFSHSFIMTSCRQLSGASTDPHRRGRRLAVPNTVYNQPCWDPRGSPNQRFQLPATPTSPDLLDRILANQLIVPPTTSSRPFSYTNFNPTDQHHENQTRQTPFLSEGPLTAQLPEPAQLER